jgi:hypothetical protein
MGERHTCFMCTMQTTNEPLAMCDQCADRDTAPYNALTAARAEGYAEGRAAERADMLAFVEEACRLGTQGDALLRALMAKGKHEGAAALGHAAGYAEAVADVVAKVERSLAGLSDRTIDATALVAMLQRGAHVGAGRKGGA